MSPIGQGDPSCPGGQGHQGGQGGQSYLGRQDGPGFPVGPLKHIKKDKALCVWHLYDPFWTITIGSGVREGKNLPAKWPQFGFGVPQRPPNVPRTPERDPKWPPTDLRKCPKNTCVFLAASLIQSSSFMNTSWKSFSLPHELTPAIRSSNIASSEFCLKIFPALSLRLNQLIERG